MYLHPLQLQDDQSAAVPSQVPMHLVDAMDIYEQAVMQFVQFAAFALLFPPERDQAST